MTLTVILLAVTALAALSPLLGADTRRPETLRTRGAGIMR